MQKNKIHILATRPLETSLLEAAAADMVIDQLSLLTTEPVQDKEVLTFIAALASQPAQIAITSINAAKAVAACLDHIPAQWKIFTIGTATKDFVSARFGGSSIAGVAENASSLADLILEAGVKEIVFFCGDLRRDELPGKLASGHVQVQQLVVYHSVYACQKIDKDYDGILFFSPGAVQSFFSVNQLPPATVIFSIGATTAESIRSCSSNPIVVSDRASAAALIEKVIIHFTHTSLLHARKK